MGRVPVASTLATFLIFISISARAVNLKGRRAKIFQHTSARTANALQQILESGVGLAELAGVKTKATPKSEVVIRTGLGENLPFHGVGYLGVGYNILMGNPQGDDTSLIDPGYRAPVVALQWSQNSRFNSRDMSLLVPKQGYAIPIVACQQATTSTRMSSMDDYQKSLAKDAASSTEVSASGGAFGISVSASAKFSGSKGTNSFRKDVLASGKERFEMKSYCVQYKLTLKTPSNTLATTEYYNERVAALKPLDMPTEGACALHLCANMYLEKEGMYIGVEGSKVVLQQKPPKGRWLFHIAQHVYWVEPPKWEIDAKKVLTEDNGKPVIQALDSKKFEKQQWMFDQDKGILFNLVGKANDKDKTLGGIGWDASKQKGNAAKELRVLQGAGKAISRNWFPERSEYPFKALFEDFGTHFVHSIELGGRMVTSVTMASKDVKAIDKTGVKAEWAAAASISGGGYGFEASASHSRSGSIKKQQEALNALKNSERETKTFVLGGDPPEDTSKDKMYGFGEWAKTVADKPMPVRITVTPISETAPFQCDVLQPVTATRKTLSPKGKRCKALRATLADMYRKYQEGTLRGFRNDNLEVSAAGNFAQSSFYAGFEHECPTKKKSSNGKYSVELSCDGELTVKDNFGMVKWASEPSPRSCYNYEKASMNIEDSRLVIACGANTESVWESYPSAKGCRVEDNKKTRLTITDNGNLELRSGNVFLWQSGSGTSLATALQKPNTVHWKPKHGYIVCKEARQSWENDLPKILTKEKESRNWDFTKAMKKIAEEDDNNNKRNSKEEKKSKQGKPACVKFCESSLYGDNFAQKTITWRKKWFMLCNSANVLKLNKEKGALYKGKSAAQISSMKQCTGCPECSDRLVTSFSV